MSKLRLIGDVHGHWGRYLELIKDVDYSIQVGDLGFDYTFLNKYFVDYTQHIAIRGNHDNTEEWDRYDHLLNSFGEFSLGGLDFYYVNGAFSIDWKLREEKRLSGEWPRTWWPDEELRQEQLDNAVELYCKVKPSVVITHDVPKSLVKYITDSRVLTNWGFDPETFSTRTQDCLEKMWQAHKPELWVAGHYHRRLDQNIDGCRFVVLEELGILDLSI